ncbi:MAG: hypothetical protein O2901_02330 [Verrucomicrobia bacterium]|nr:hypothetical protein [Verrucomicrobiota bacterium]
MANGHQKFLEQNAYAMGFGDLIGLLVILVAIAILVGSGRCFVGESDKRSARPDFALGEPKAVAEWHPAQRGVRVASDEWQVAGGKGDGR